MLGRTGRSVGVSTHGVPEMFRDAGLLSVMWSWLASVVCPAMCKCWAWAMCVRTTCPHVCTDVLVCVAVSGMALWAFAMRCGRHE
eukprot:11658728-Alexandrium_andersonii.AAC.1